MPRKPFSKRPTLETINALKDQRTRFAARNQMIMDIRDYRYRRREPTYLETNEKTKVPIKLASIDDGIVRVASLLGQNGIKWHINPFGEANDGKAQALADKQERWLDGARNQLEIEADDELFDMSLDSICESGLSIEKVIYKAGEWWENYPELGDLSEEGFDQVTTDFKKQATLPFAVRRVDPLSFYPFYDEYGLAMCLEIGTKDPIAAKVAFGIDVDDQAVVRVDKTHGLFLTGDQAPDGMEAVEEIHYWDRRWYAHVVADKFVARFQHGYGRVPYFVAKGIKSNSRRAEEEARSVVDGLMATIQALNTLLTAQGAAALNYGYPTPMITTAEDTAVAIDPKTQKPFDIEWTPGKVIHLRTGQTLSFPHADALRPGGPIIELLGILKALGEQSSVAPILSGQSGSELTGYLASQLMQAAQTVFVPIKKSMERREAEKMKFILQIVRDRFEESVPILHASDVNSSGTRGAEWIELGPDQLKQIPMIEAIIDPGLPVSVINEGNFWLTAHAQGAVDMKFVREQLQVQDTTSMGKRVDLERIKQDPDVIQLAKDIGLARTGTKDAAAAAIQTANQKAAEQASKTQNILAGAEGGEVPFPSGGGSATNQPGGMPEETLANRRATPPPSGRAGTPDPGGPGNEGTQG